MHRYMCSDSNNNNYYYYNNCYFLYSTFVDVSLSETLLSSAGLPQSIENLCPSKEKEREGRDGERGRGREKEGSEKEGRREGERRKREKEEGREEGREGLLIVIIINFVDIKDLNLSKTLLSSWNEVAIICSQLHSLTKIDLRYT